jgi:MFS family permease
MPIFQKGGMLALRAANFLAQYHHILIVFIVSTFLSRFFGAENVGWVVAGASFIVAFGIFEAPVIFTRMGTTRALFIFSILEILSLVGLATTDSAFGAVCFFTLQGVFAFSMFIGLDLLLEAETLSEKKTGNARGAFLAISNTAAFVATLSLAWISVGEEYSRVFLAAAAALIPFSLLVIFALPKISYALGTVRTPIKKLWSDLQKDKMILTIMGAHFLLQLFFVWMALYVPLFLHSSIGFSWSTIGFMLTAAMLPYVLFEYPLGWIADKILGEKELMITGFIILGVTTIAISFLDGAGAVAWGILLFMTRFGAAMVEVMTETHFFRTVNHNDSGTIGLFRMLRPLSGVVGPVVASIALLFTSLPSLFIIFGCILFLGIPLGLTIKDFR